MAEPLILAHGASTGDLAASTRGWGKRGATMRAFYKDFYGCFADLCQYRSGTTRLVIRDPHGNIIHRKEYRTWRGAKIAMGKMGDCWTNMLHKH